MDIKRCKRVGIVGGGPSGLAAIKSCLEEGFEPTAFERQDQLGGTWVYRPTPDPRYPEAATVYQCLKTNTSKALFGYTDFPPPTDWTPFVGHRKCLEYFQSYAKAFDLTKYIRFNTEVTRLFPTEDYDTTGRWRLRTRVSGTPDPAEEEFDAVMICTGYYSNAKLPAYPGQETFQGDITVGNSYRDNSKYLDKTVLVVGCSVSGGDIATDISNSSHQTFVSCRNGFHLTPVIGSSGWPVDVYLSRRFAQLLGPSHERRAMEREARKFRTIDLGLPPPRTPAPTGTVVNDNFVDQVACGKIIPKPGIHSFSETGVVFVDGSRVEGLDSVVFCTGYRNTIPFVDESTIPEPLRERDLYSYVLPAKMTHQTLACIGFFKNLAVGSPVTTLEMQARWVAQVWAGNCPLPPREEMLADIRRRRRENSTNFGSETFQIRCVPYMDLLASRIGCYPSLLPMFFSDPLLAIHIMFSPVVPASYRLVGPHRWRGARSTVLNSWNATFEGTRCTGATKQSRGFLPVVMKSWIFAVVFLGLTVLVKVLMVWWDGRE